MLQKRKIIFALILVLGGFGFALLQSKGRTFFADPRDLQVEDFGSRFGIESEETPALEPKSGVVISPPAPLGGDPIHS